MSTLGGASAFSTLQVPARVPDGGEDGTRAIEEPVEIGPGQGLLATVKATEPFDQFIPSS